jgi:hypothetical protein
VHKFSYQRQRMGYPIMDTEKTARWIKTARVIYWVITGSVSVTLNTVGVADFARVG